MFGLLHACSTVLDAELLVRWRAHLCGLCLTLRDDYGQPARTLTNTDAVALAVLVDAQHREPVTTRVAGPCPLRAMRTAPVIVRESGSMRLAATASVTLAAARAQDHAGERRHDLGAGGWSSRAEDLAMTGLAPVLRRLAHQDQAMAHHIDSRRTLLELDGQGAQEAAVRPGDPLLDITTTSATAAGRIFAASAEVAGRPENVADLTIVGEAFGSLAHLLDAVEDLERDARVGAFNPIVATGSSLSAARRECGRLVRRIRRHVDRLHLDLDLPDARLARCLLIDGTHQAVHRAFAAAGVPSGAPAGHRSSPHASAIPDTGRNEPPRSPGAPPDPDQLPQSPEPPPEPGSWPADQPPPAPKNTPRPPFWSNILPFATVYCTGYACCAEHENHCTGERHAAACSGGDACSGCGDCDCDCCCDGCDCDC